MAESQRGSTLVELLVVVGIVALLLAAGGIAYLGMRPGALAVATNDFDAELASARAFASTSGNGATLVFSPRTAPATTGFELRVYSGRPTSAAAVSSTTAMPVVSDATIAEKTLGTPPFAIFIGASGHVSGAASYPSFGRNGKITFPAIASEPACPKDGFVLTFTSPQGAIQTRSIPCGIPLVSTTAAPNPSPTPNVPVVTPTALIYHWPADARQSFVATEWGYTHWFAATGFTCGDDVATYPNVLPSPFTPAYSKAEADASPAPPSQTPYSYPNSNGQSMNDAPATFPLDPAAEGLCNATVADDYGQQAQSAVQVMGWLKATYGGQTATHLTSPLALPASAFPRKGASATIALSKTYDTEDLAPQVVLDSVCALYLSSAVANGTTPSSPSKTPATASITFTMTDVPPTPVSCTGTLYDQYAGSQSGEGVTINAKIGASQLQTWPSYVMYPSLGGSLVSNGACSENQPQAYTDSSFSKPLASATPPAGFLTAYSTDSYGCMLYAGSGGSVTVDQTKTGAGGVSILVADPNNTGGGSGPYVAGNPYAGSACNRSSFSTAFYSNSGTSAGVVGEGLGATSCAIGLTDPGTPIATTQSTTAIEVTAAPCSGKTCAVFVYFQEDSYTVGHNCGGNPDCSSNYGSEGAWVTTDGGNTWTPTLPPQQYADSECLSGNGCDHLPTAPTDLGNANAWDKDGYPTAVYNVVDSNGSTSSSWLISGNPPANIVNGIQPYLNSACCNI